ncbi:hypothetical protein DERF_004039 [Dermatophagoides farinae]|uniref:Uncharacterized protein n=1 Tax=Dermatophagoides farinae TaxID=6954 RepID=A0A922LCU7_DERFA|nr:hypothetical protein DERF_004039 [Dermatophagoides farinae]
MIADRGLRCCCSASSCPSGSPVRLILSSITDFVTIRRSYAKPNQAQQSMNNVVMLIDAGIEQSDLPIRPTCPREHLLFSLRDVYGIVASPYGRKKSLDENCVGQHPFPNICDELDDREPIRRDRFAMLLSVTPSELDAKAIWLCMIDVTIIGEHRPKHRSN